MKLELYRTQTKAFQWVKFSHNHQLVKGHFPDFLIIGPQRTGTTWLAKQIRSHPEIFMTFPKELYFFSRLGALHSRHYDHFDWRNLINRPKKSFKELVKIFYLDFIRTGAYSANQLEWYLNFFKNDLLQKMVNKDAIGNVTNYDSLLKGEATASYAILDRQIIEEIKLLNPHIKAILMIRDPVSRSWSHVKKDLLRNPDKTLPQLSKDKFYEFFKAPYQIAANSYKENITRWSEVLGKENLFVGRFDQIKQQPLELLKRIYSFLEVTVPMHTSEKDLYEKVNFTKQDIIPKEFESFLKELYSKEIQYLEDHYPKHNCSSQGG